MIEGQIEESIMTATEQMNANPVPLDKRVASLCAVCTAICISMFFSISAIGGIIAAGEH